jgi:hypothetical protein
MEKHEVLIDGKPNTLTLVKSPRPGILDHYQYNTDGNWSAHCFNTRLTKGQVRRTNGHLYKILT